MTTEFWGSYIQNEEKSGQFKNKWQSSNLACIWVTSVGGTYIYICSNNSGGRSAGIVRSRNKVTELVS
jgi:hypothetical protein